MTRLELWNEALSLLGSSVKVVNPDADETEEARRCRQHWPFCMGTVFAEANWSFALEATHLVEDTEAPAPIGFAHRFALPLSFVRLAEVLDIEPGDYRKESGFILTDETAVTARCVKLPADGTIAVPVEYYWDGTFTMAVATYLAYLMAITMSASTTKKRTLLDDYNGLLRRAKDIDMIQSGPFQNQEVDEWEQIRW